MSVGLQLRQVIVLALSAGALAAMAFDPPDPIRPIVALLFLLIAPGLALTAWLRVSDLLLETALVVVLSFAIEMSLAMLTVYAGLWSPELVLVLCVVVIFVALLGAGRLVPLAERRGSG